MRERIGAEDGERDRRHADLSGPPAAEADIVKIGDGAVVRQQEIGPFTGQDFQPAWAQRFNKQIATFPIKRRQLTIMLRRFAQHVGDRQLRRGIHREGQILVHLAQFGADGRRGHAVADLPAGHMKGFAKRRDRHRPLAQLWMRQYAGVAALSKADMLIDFIAQDIDLAFGDRLPQGGKILALPDGGRRVVRGVEDHQPGFLAQGGGKLPPVDAKMRRLQRNTT